MSTTTTQLSPRTAPIQPGDPAPDFTLKDQDQNDWTLSQACAKGDVVLCFYPLDFSPVCSTEMKCATTEMQSFVDRGAQVVGISGDSFFTHKAWADQLGLTHTLLADMHREVCKAYGFYFPDLNVPSRGTVIVAKNDQGDLVVKWSQSRDIPQAMEVSEVLGAMG